MLSLASSSTGNVDMLPSSGERPGQVWVKSNSGLVTLIPADVRDHQVPPRSAVEADGIVNPTHATKATRPFPTDRGSHDHSR